jgi:glutamine amidotransferase
MITILKYNGGNVASVQNALTRLGVTSVVSDDPDFIRNSEKVILPGVGAAATAMKDLKSKGLDVLIKELKQPVLGICLGMQLMCKSSEEGNISCLGIFDNEVRKFQGDALIPHMGWNNLQQTEGSLFSGLDAQADMYFVHSYYVDIGESTRAVCDYIQPFSAALEKDNFYATQFHPEKSSDMGSKLLENFVNL